MRELAEHPDVGVSVGLVSKVKQALIQEGYAIEHERLLVRPEGYILIKAFALDERTNPKDAYDIDFVLRNSTPDIESLAGRVRPLLPNGLARQAYEILKTKFATLGSVGPSWAAKVAEEQGENLEQSQRAAFEYAQALFEATEKSH